MNVASDYSVATLQMPSLQGEITSKREVDFVVTSGKKPLFAVDCKTGEAGPSPHLRYFAERTDIPKFYQVHLGSRHQQISDRISLLPFEAFAEEVGLV